MKGKKIEENTSLINKKAFEDQFTGFFISLVLGLSFSLSLIPLDTQSFLEVPLEECGMLGIWSKKATEEQESER